MEIIAEYGTVFMILAIVFGFYMALATSLAPT